MVMGGDSHSEGCGFKSRYRILDGHFSHIFVVKICNVCLKRPKINEKEEKEKCIKRCKRYVCEFLIWFNLSHRFVSSL